MAAPATAYFNIGASFRGNNNLTMVVNPAKANADLATLKSRFYLDDVIGFKANYNGVNYHGFWGLVIRGGLNERHHKASRQLEINVQKASAERTYNDAGLNTMGGVLSDPAIVTQIDGFIVEPTFRSAYYVPTTSFGIRYRVQGADGQFTPYFEQTVTQTRAQDEQWSFAIYLNNLTQDTAKINDLVHYNTFIVNAEGRFDNPTINVVRVTLVPIRLRIGSPTAAVTTLYATTTSFVMADQDNNGVLDAPIEDISKLYREQTPGNYVPANPGNYYFENDPNYYYVIGSVNTAFTNLFVRIVNAGGGGGQPQWEERTFVGFFATQARACLNAIENPTIRTIYRRYTENTWYTTSSFTIVAGNGYYVTDNPYDIYIISGGILANTNNSCPI